MKKRKMVYGERLKAIANIIIAVENRCMAADGDVTPTTQEITEDELRQIYKLASTGGAQPSREREVPLDPMLPLSLTDVQEATDMYVECDGKLKRDYRGLAVVLNARVKAWFLERSTATPASTGEQS